MVVGRIAGGLEFGRYFDRWLAYDFALIPSAPAAAEHLQHLLAAAAITLSLLGAGRLLLGAVRFVAHNLWEEAALSFGFGYGFVGTILLLAGLCGFWSRGFLTAFLVALAVLSAAGLADLFKSARGALGRTEYARPRALTSCGVFFVVILWLHALRYALIPETFYDALVYHLALPAQYLLHGRIYPTPSNSFSGVPALPQMISGLALAIEPWGIAASILHCGLLLWCGVALVGLSRRLGRPRAGILAAAIFAATPVVLGESFRVSVGLEWALMELCCLTGVLAAAEEQSGLSGPALIVAGSFLGFAMATKYPAWLLALAVIPPLALGRLSTEADRRRFIKRLVVLGAIAMVFIAPWVLKNVFFYANPLYPFFHEHFAAAGATVPDWRQISAAGTDLRRFLAPGGLYDYLAHPWDFLKPAEDVSETTGPVYLALLPGLLLFPFERRGKLVALFALAAWIPLSALSPQPRYFIPHLAVVALLVANLIEGLESRWAAASFRAGALRAGLGRHGLESGETPRVSRGPGLPRLSRPHGRLVSDAAVCRLPVPERTDSRERQSSAVRRVARLLSRSRGRGLVGRSAHRARILGRPIRRRGGAGAEGPEGRGFLYPRERRRDHATASSSPRHAGGHARSRRILEALHLKSLRGFRSEGPLGRRVQSARGRPSGASSSGRRLFQPVSEGISLSADRALSFRRPSGEVIQFPT